MLYKYVTMLINFTLKYVDTDRNCSRGFLALLPCRLLRHFVNLSVATSVRRKFNDCCLKWRIAWGATSSLNIKTINKLFAHRSDNKYRLD